ncbi:MAG: prephenate dehydrogenase [Lachnospiraceae bacterium]|nr:prephenate dehydrogenase [Lachnospiraceae bacterium]
MFQTIAFIGLGLIGGSIARKIKQVHPNTTIMAYARTRSTLEAAKADGNVDVILDGINEQLSSCDLIILCTPVSYNAEYLRAIRPFLNKDCIISDVGSTKTAIHEAVIQLDMESQFIGGHPMAGSERTGYACSKANLLENAYYVITPTAKNRQEDIDRMVAFARDLTALPLVLDYREHDYSVAAISHVPHLIASGLVNLVADSDSKEQVMKRIAAGGFKDITRIASSSPVMWEQICMTNKENIISLLRDYIRSMQQIVTDLENDDNTAIYNCFERSGIYRNSISDRGNSTLNPEFALYCDIPDKAGAISVLASLLAFENISIKNIGINHNREHQEGTLKIEFHEQASCEKAKVCLEYHHYKVYSRS